jgi:hypothetical protein
VRQAVQKMVAALLRVEAGYATVLRVRDGAGNVL